MKRLSPTSFLALVVLFALAVSAVIVVARHQTAVPKSVPGASPEQAAKPGGRHERFCVALGDTDRTRRSFRFDEIFAELTPQEAAAWAEQFLASETNSPFQNDWLDFLRHWGRLDHDAALAFADQRGKDNRMNWQRAILKGWVAQDVDAAAKWLLTQDAEGRKNFGATIAEVWTLSDWQAVRRWLDQWPASEDPRNAIISAAKVLTGTLNFIALEQWIDALPTTPKNQPSRQVLFEMLASALDHRKGADWLAWMLSRPRDLALTSELVKRAGVIAERLDGSAQFDVRLVGQFLTRPDPAPQWQRPSWGFLEIFRTWVRFDPEAASIWLAQHPTHDFRSSFICQLVDTVAESDVEAALSWATIIAEEKTRRLAFSYLAAPLMAADAAKAQRILAAEGVTEIDLGHAARSRRIRAERQQQTE